MKAPEANWARRLLYPIAMQCVAPPAAAVAVELPAQDRHRSIWSRHLYILPAFLIALAVCGWFASWGDWNFFQPESLGAFYDAQALSLINGHFDVPRQAIGFEAFIVDGKYYGYFGIGPALLRIPLLIAFPQLDGLWSRAMLMLGSVIGIACVYRILFLLRGDNPRTRSEKVFDSIFILTAAIGSTNVFIIARSFVYHEATMWGGAFALLFACALVSYLRSPNTRSLVFAATFAFMSFQSRPTAGAGALLGLCIVVVIAICRVCTRKEICRNVFALGGIAHPRKHLIIATAAIAATLFTFFGVNYAKFGTFSALPLQYYQQYMQTPDRMQSTGARQIHLKNLPTGIATYFGPRGVRLDPHFPWIYLANEVTIVGSPVLDIAEPFSTFPASMPALTLLAIIGGFTLVRSTNENIRRFRLPAIALLLGGSISLMSAGITERYMHDLYPALIVCAATGLYSLSLGKHRPLKLMLLVPLVVVSIVANCAFALVYQRVQPWGVPPAKRAQFDRMQTQIGARF